MHSKVFVLLLAAACMAFLASCASTETGQSSQGNNAPVASQKGLPTNSSKRLFLINADGSRTEIPYYENPPSAGFIAPPYEWDPSISPSGPVQLVIRLDEQRIYIYRNRILIGYSQISTGKEGLVTPAGKYKVLQKDKDHKSSKYGSFVSVASGNTVNDSASAGQKAPSGTRYEPSPMPYFLRITNDGVGIHEGYLPGYPASHGCIRIHPDMAPRIYEVVPLGAEVTIMKSKSG